MDEQGDQQFREIASEYEVDEKRSAESNTARRCAISIAVRVAAWPAGAIFAWVAVACELTFREDRNYLPGLICGGIVLTFATAFAGIASGWLAHRIFWGSRISVTRIAFAFASIYVCALFGWTLVLFSKLRPR